MHPPGAVKLVPLAPPARTASTSRDTRSFNWPAWLSPKISRPSHLNRRQTERNDNSFFERRERRASFDETSSRDDPMLIVPSNSADHAFDGASRKDFNSSSKDKEETKSKAQSSLLTAFLLSLNELLPEYCDHLMKAADIGPSNEAAKAISVLESGSKKLSHGSPRKRDDVQSRSLTSGHGEKGTSPQTRSPTFSPSQFLKQLSTGSPVKELRQSFLSPSPTNRSRLGSTGSDNAPRSAPSSPSFLERGMSRTAANEWERFVSPFLMLAAAEVLYGRMDHVVNPASEKEFNAQHRPDAKLRASDGDITPHLPTLFRFPFLDCFRDASTSTQERAGPLVETLRKSPIVSFAGSKVECSDSSRGSKRLIALYHQIRGDLIIVGEYLCDPVLGSRAVENKPSQDLIPPLPYQEEDLVTQLKPKLSKSVDESNSKNTDSIDARRVAALSLRDKLSNLISFIEARCVLIKAHADLCTWDTSPDSFSTTAVAVAKRCESILLTSPLTATIQREAKALNLALTVITHIESHDFFQCTLSIRKLYLLLGSSPTIDRGFLPMMWMRTCFARILSLVRIMFSDTSSSVGITPSEPKLSRTLSSNKKIREETTPRLPQTSNFDMLSSEIVSSNGTDVPLAIIVARRTDDNSWLPIYVNSSNQMPGESSKFDWHLSLWNRVEHSLNEHSNIVTPRKTYSIDSKGDSKESNAKNDSKLNIPLIGKKPNPGTSSTCHIATSTKNISLVVIRGSDGGRKQKVTDDEISRFIDTSLPLLLPSNIFNIDGVLSAKTLMQPNSPDDTHHFRNTTALKGYSLWEGLEWSEHKQKQKLLNVLGLRKSTNSPIIAPLKSPYVKSLRRRRKKTKSTMNHGHLALFLGNDLSQIIL